MDHQIGPDEQQDTEQALTKNRNGVAMQCIKHRPLDNAPIKSERLEPNNDLTFIDVLAKFYDVKLQKIAI